MLHIDKLKAWAIGEYAAAKGALSAEVTDFVVWVEGKSAIEDATALLQANGYTVTEPLRAAAPQP